LEPWFGDLAGEAGVSGAGALHVFPRMLAALLLGGLVAFRPWQRRARPKPEIAQTQLLMCAAAALIVVVIGDSVARAFGVVGLGGFIRFRTGIKDPRDAAVLFLVIGVGMAAGLGMYGLAAAGAAMVAAVLLGLDFLSVPRGKVERMRLLVEGDREQIERAFAGALGADGYRLLATRPASGPSGIWLEVEGPEGLAGRWDRRGKKVGRLLSWERLGPEVPAAAGRENVA
jgi:hypothetical protein